MKLSKFLQSQTPLILSAFCLYLASSISVKYERPYIFIANQDKSVNFNDQFLERFNLGLKRLISSSLWISTILESDIDHYKQKDLNSWMFRRFKSISILEPYFYENYAFGGPYLSIIKDDLEGASTIYNTGISYFPNDYTLLRDAGFHFYFEVGDLPRSFQIYSALKNNPKASLQILTTLARINSNNGNLPEAFELLNSKYNELVDKNTFFARKLRSQLYAIKSEIDLTCLNSKNNLNKCSKVDFNQKKYILSGGEYRAEEKWIPFRVKRKSQKASAN
jgi:hypothetical protein